MTHDTQQPCRDQIELEFIRSHKFRDRFFGRVIAVASGCHEWTGALDRKGYGNIKTVERLTRRTHRVALSMELGRTISSDEHVCHSCDNRKCVNTDHLWIGSNADNVADMVAKGRNGGNIRRREENASTKVSYAQIEEMRTLKANGVAVKEIAARYGLSPNYACRIILYLKEGEGSATARRSLQNDGEAPLPKRKVVRHGY